MAFSNAALKGTVGSGGLGVLAVWIEPADPTIGFWPLFAIVMAPFLILLFVKRGELPERAVTIGHLIAVTVYAALVLGSLGLMAHRGFQRTDLLFGFFMALGTVPCVSAALDIARRIRRDTP